MIGHLFKSHSDCIVVDLGKLCQELFHIINANKKHEVHNYFIESTAKAK